MKLVSVFLSIVFQCVRSLTNVHIKNAFTIRQLWVL